MIMYLTCDKIQHIILLCVVYVYPIPTPHPLETFQKDATHNKPCVNYNIYLFIRIDDLMQNNIRLYTSIEL